MDSYDEDLNENPFLQSFLTSCPDLFSQCVLEQWLICVPRKDSLPKYTFSLEDFTHHVLRPIEDGKGRRWSGESSYSSASSGSFLSPPSASESSLSDQTNNLSSPRLSGANTWNYRTLSHINVEIAGRAIILDIEIPIQAGVSGVAELTNNNSNFVHLRKEILFEETFYTTDGRKYKVLCVSSPLNSKVDVEDEAFGNSGLGIWNLTSLRDCIDFIWAKGGLTILETYDAYAKLFLNQHPALETLPLPIQRNLVNGLYLKCLEFAVNTGIANKPDNPALTEFILQKLKIATETYILNGVFRPLISAITSVTATEDAFMNKVMRNLYDIHPQDLDISSTYWNVLSKAKHELGRISSYSTPLGKLACMKRTTRLLRTCSSQGGDSTVLSTDEIIPILVYLILKNPLGNWIAQLEFLRHFRFSSADQPDNENSFYVVTLEACLEYIKTGKLLGINDSERDVGPSSDVGGEPWLYSLSKEAYESDNQNLTEMFEVIRQGNCQRLEELIDDYENERCIFNEKQKEPKHLDTTLLCHPLCHCEKCSSVYTKVQPDKPMEKAVDLQTDDGLTMLHVACIYGRPKVVDFLIGSGSDLEIADNQGMTALHYAASRGHQNALLLLLHAGCVLDATTNTGNTALHLSAQNGHEACVKALIYYAEHVGKNIHLSAGNIKGDTPLHFASRWGFIGIVNILTEHGAAIMVPNGKHATPIDCAHDVHILRILQRSLRRRSLVQSNHGDYVNIEMMQKEDSGRIVMLVTEPTETSENSMQSREPSPRADGNSKPSSRAPSRSSSRRGSFLLPNLVLPTKSPSRSRRVSTIKNPLGDPQPIPTVYEDIETCLLNVAEKLQHELSSPDFVLNYYDDVYEATEQEHLKTVNVECLEKSDEIRQAEVKKERDLPKLFSSVKLGDVPLALHYLGIPADEFDNPEYEENDHITVLPPCHPLCPCKRCTALAASGGVDIDTMNGEGLSCLHLSVKHHVEILVKILIRYGASINLQSTYDKMTALDYAVERGFHDIEQTLLACGAQQSTSFCPSVSEEE